jgi:hypothetical protein
LINFNETLLSMGIKRIVNRPEEDPRRPPLPRDLRVKMRFVWTFDLNRAG